MLPAVALGLGVAGGVANYLGGKSEARRKQAALDDYNRQSAQLYDQMAKDAWAAGTERQKANRQVIEGLTPTMSAAPSVAPDVASFLPETQTDQFRGEDFLKWMQSAGATQQGVSQANLNATQAGLDRTALMRALDGLGYTSSLETQANAPAHQRLQWQKQQELEQARQRLEAILGSTGNKARNLQLLGSLLGTAGQATLMAGAMGGGPAASSATGAATYGGGSIPGPAVAGSGQVPWTSSALWGP